MFLDNPTAPWHWLPAKGAQGLTPLPGLRSAVGKVIEMAIPLEEFAGGTVRILPILRDTAAGKNFDEWSGWIDVQ